MPHQNTVFRQVIQFIPWGRLDRLIAEHKADKGVHHLDTRSHLLALIFAQLTGARGLRDVEALLESHAARRYHAGLPRARRATLADANKRRSVAVFTGLFGALADKLDHAARKKLGESVYLLDSTTFPLSELSEWSRYRADLLGVKAHVLYDATQQRPSYFVVTPARVNDITAAWDMPIDPGATIVFDLGYYEFRWWALLDKLGCRFVTRLKSNTRLRVISEQAAPKESNILSDRTGFLPERMASSRRNPIRHAVREIRVRLDTGKEIRVVSNDLDAPAEEIAALYRKRWRIELFFRWVKQALKIRHFFGNNENAVRVQIAVALITYLLIQMAHGTQTAVRDLTRFARLVMANAMHRRPIGQLLWNARETEPIRIQDRQQMALL